MLTHLSGRHLVLAAAVVVSAVLVVAQAWDLVALLVTTKVIPTLSLHRLKNLKGRAILALNRKLIALIMLIQAMLLLRRRLVLATATKTLVR